ncbi:MAG: hypothetical protein ACRCXZ_09630, partial [Patescibacteria group bacterium]
MKREGNFSNQADKPKQTELLQFPLEKRPLIIQMVTESLSSEQWQNIAAQLTDNELEFIENKRCQPVRDALPNQSQYDSISYLLKLMSREQIQEVAKVINPTNVEFIFDRMTRKAVEIEHRLERIKELALEYQVVAKNVSTRMEDNDYFTDDLNPAQLELLVELRTANCQDVISTLNPSSKNHFKKSAKYLSKQTIEKISRMFNKNNEQILSRALDRASLTFETEDGFLKALDDFIEYTKELESEGYPIDTNHQPFIQEFNIAYSPNLDPNYQFSRRIFDLVKNEIQLGFNNPTSSCLSGFYGLAEVVGVEKALEALEKTRANPKFNSVTINEILNNLETTPTKDFDISVLDENEFSNPTNIRTKANIARFKNKEFFQSCSKEELVDFLEYRTIVTKASFNSKPVYEKYSNLPYSNKEPIPKLISETLNFSRKGIPIEAQEAIGKENINIDLPIRDCFLDENAKITYIKLF